MSDNGTHDIERLLRWIQSADTNDLLRSAMVNPPAYEAVSKAMRCIRIGSRRGSQCVLLAAAALQDDPATARQRLLDHPGVLAIIRNYFAAYPPPEGSQLAELQARIAPLL